MLSKENAATTEQSQEQTDVGGDHWSAGLSDDLAKHGDVSGSKSLEDFVGRYIEHRGTLSRSIVMPNEEAGQDEMDKFYNRLEKVPNVARVPSVDDKDGWKDLYRKIGVPDAANDYGIENEDLAKTLHSLNLNKGQAGRVAELIGKVSANSNEERDATYQKGADELKEKWGGEEVYEKRAKAASKVIADFGGDAAFEFLAESGEGNNPALLEMMYKISKNMSERKLTRGEDDTAKYGMDKAEIQQSISSIMNNANDPYHDKTHPDHERRVLTVAKYYEELNNS